jgi:hypothetical protein
MGTKSRKRSQGAKVAFDDFERACRLLEQYFKDDGSVSASDAKAALDVTQKYARQKETDARRKLAALKNIDHLIDKGEAAMALKKLKKLK